MPGPGQITYDYSLLDLDAAILKSISMAAAEEILEFILPVSIFKADKEYRSITDDWEVSFSE